MNSHILRRIGVTELHIFLHSKSIFLKQLDVLSLKKHKVMLFLRSQYQHSKFSRFKIVDSRRQCAYSLVVYILAVQKSHHQIFRAIAYHSVPQTYLKLQENYVKNLVLMNYFNEPNMK